jgi:hypothetical protein
MHCPPLLVFSCGAITPVLHYIPQLRLRQDTTSITYYAKVREQDRIDNDKICEARDMIWCSHSAKKSAILELFIVTVTQP